MKNHSRIPFLALVLLSHLILTACGSSLPKPVIDYKPDYDFTSIKSYVITPAQASYSASLVGERIESAIENELTQHGLQINEQDAADVQVRYLVIKKEKQDIRTFDRYYGGAAYQCWRCGPSIGMVSTDVQVYNYTEGTLIIDIIDPSLKRTVWHAISKGRIKENLSPEQRDEKVRAVVASMLKQFPPQKGT